MNSALSMLGLAKKAGYAQIGEEPAGAAARASKAKLIATASDAAENTVRRAKHFAKVGGTVWISLPFTKEELGNQVGRTSCAILALTDIGMAAGLAARLAAAEPERYSQLAESLGGRAEKAEIIKKQAHVHDRKKKAAGHSEPAGKRKSRN